VDELDLIRGTNGEKRSAYRILIGKSETKTQLGRPRRRWKILTFISGRWVGMLWTGLL
jgi:hypothetical protein